MCVAVLAWKTHPDYPLMFAGNRDELHARPSLAAGFWDDVPEVLGGRDLKAGGTWLGVSRGGRFAVVTNYRIGPNPQSGPRSRGELTADFLRGDAAPQTYLHAVAKRAKEYAPFSLIVGDADTLWYCSNRDPRAPFALTPGIHGLSNHLLDTPWPKVSVSMARLEALLAHNAGTSDALFKLLADRTPAPIASLPDTGIGVQREQALSSVFVVNPEYGTRCSSLILRARNGDLDFAERRFDAEGRGLETRYFDVAGNET